MPFNFRRSLTNPKSKESGSKTKEAKVKVEAATDTRPTTTSSLILQDGMIIDPNDPNDAAFASSPPNPTSNKSSNKNDNNINGTAEADEDVEGRSRLPSLGASELQSISQDDLEIPLPSSSHPNNANASPFPPIPKGKKPGWSSTCTHSLYGSPAPSNQVRQEMGLDDDDNTIPEDGGLLWTIQIIPNNYNESYTPENPTLLMLPKNNYDPIHQRIKPRRGGIACTAHQFFSSLTQVYSSEQETELDDDSYNIFPAQCKWVFSGVMNGWPALRNLEVLKIQTKGVLPISKWTTVWNSKDVTNVSAPFYPRDLSQIGDVRAKVRAPGWSGFGWSKDSLGFVLWYEGLRPEPRLTYGTNIIQTFEQDRFNAAKSKSKPLFKPSSSPSSSPKCTQVHMISHRYSMGDNESMKDYITYHSLALLEWDHGQHCTVVEGAWLNGLGGANGKSNWIEDKEEKLTKMFECFPPEMVMPWKNTLSEIRCTDVKAKNLEEHLAFMECHTGKDKRFLDVQVTFSHPVRLTFCSKEQIAQYLINYIRRGRTYSEIRANCQTFVADFCSLLAGKKDVQPFHPLNRIEYRNQKHHFLYESTMYPTKEV